MSLDIYLVTPTRCPHCGGTVGEEAEVYSANITHNLHPMWREAGVDDALYQSEGETAASILPMLRAGVEMMEYDPQRFKRHDSPNGWGLYVNALPWLKRLAEACEEHPTAIIRVSK